MHAWWGIGEQPAHQLDSDSAAGADSVRHGRYWSQGRALRPWKTVDDGLAANPANNLDSRLEVAPVADEIAALIGDKRATRTARACIRDAERRLRVGCRGDGRGRTNCGTPLAVLRTGLESRACQGTITTANPPSADRGNREVLALCKIADELLMLARLNARSR